MIDISCSIVLFHNPVEEVRVAIESFLNCNYNCRLYIVDNSSNDHMRFQFISPQIEYIFTGRNIGYGAAHNLAIKKVMGKSKYHIILNPDVEFDPAILDTLYNYMQVYRHVGLVMPKVFYKNGKEQYLCKKLPAPSDLIMRRFIPAPLQFLFKKKLEQYELKHKDFNTIMEIPNLSGCFMFIRTEVFSNVGLFDERFFLYLEDTDLCRRIHESYLTVFHPGVSIIHGYSKASYKSFKLMKHHLKSSVSYFNKWGWLFDYKRRDINQSVLRNPISPRLIQMPSKELRLEPEELLIVA